MHALMILAIGLTILAIVLWTAGVNQVNNNYANGDLGVIMLVIGLVIFIISSYSMYMGTKQQTSEEVLKYLTNKGVIELQIDESDNKTKYVLTPEADSTGWRPLYLYLKGQK